VKAGQESFPLGFKRTFPLERHKGSKILEEIATFSESRSTNCNNVRTISLIAATGHVFVCDQEY
jgi:hypothetical protein